MKKRNVWVVCQDEQGNTWEATRPIVFRPGRNERERVSKSVRVRVAKGPSHGGILRRLAQQPTHGVLFSGDAHPRRQKTRHSFPFPMRGEL